MTLFVKVLYNTVGNVQRKGKPMRTTAVISSKGQIVIPAHLRKRYGMKEGTTIVFQEDHGRLVLTPSNYDAIFALAGSLRDYPLEEDLEQERQSERNRENQR
jgi:AbrB family looped-hinge helix DNA binding protein